MPLLVFRTLEHAEAVLREYVRYLGLDLRTMVHAFRRRHAPLAMRLERLAIQDLVEDEEPDPGLFAELPPQATPRIERGAVADIEREAAPATPPPPPRPVPRLRSRQHQRRQATRRRRAVAGLAVAGLVPVTALALRAAASDTPASTAASPTSPKSPVVTASPTPAPQELPGGGFRLFPDRRVVAYYGSPLTPDLGVLGHGEPEEVLTELRAQAEEYSGPGRRPVLPAFHVIATVAADAPGPEEEYNFQIPRDVVRRYVEAAREAGVLVILDIQPGRARFIDEVVPYEEFLKEPHVGLGLDPEWRVDAPEVPHGGGGVVDASEVNEVAEYVSSLVRENTLPQKLFIVHQFKEPMITNREDIVRPSDELAVVLDIDGVGHRGIKLKKYDELTADAPWHIGIKLYYRTDVELLQPHEVLRLSPRPELVIYQ